MKCKIRFPDLDGTWRLIWRAVPRGYGDDVDGVDSYAFQRKGGDRPTDLYTIHIIPVETFWGTKELA